MAPEQKTQSSIAAPLPSFATLTNQKLVVPSSKKPFIAVDEHFLQRLMEPLLSRIKVDETWYLEQYPDVRAAILEGVVPDATTHYVKFGYFEHRMPHPIEVSDRWYLEMYPDVQEAVTAKAFTSGQQHFERVGFREGRFPYAGFEFECTESQPESVAD